MILGPGGVPPKTLWAGFLPVRLRLTSLELRCCGAIEYKYRCARISQQQHSKLSAEIVPGNLALHSRHLVRKHLVTNTPEI